MRIDKSPSAPLLAAMPGIALSACQRQPTPSARGSLDLPTLPGERFGAPSSPGAREGKPAWPGSGLAFDPHHRPPPGPALIAS